MNSKCYLCGCEKLVQRDGVVRDAPELRVLECAECGLVFLSSFSHIDKIFYESSQMHKDCPLDHNQWLAETTTDDQRRACYLKDVLAGKDVLDFGCGAGGFLLNVRETAASAIGIEPEKRAVDACRAIGLEVYPDLETLPSHRAFDHITLFHVLEHLTDPKATLSALRPHLKEGGNIVIEVPNADDALLTLYDNKAFSRFTYWSCHVFLYTESTLAALMNSCGFTCEDMVQVQRYPLSNHLHWLAKGKPGGHNVWGFLDNKGADDGYAATLNEHKMCDTIIGTFSI